MKIILGTFILIPALSTYAADIHKAVLKNDPALVKSILEKSPGSVNARDRYGLTPLHLAAARGQVEIIEVLTDLGADINAPALDGKTAWSLASEKGQTAAAGLLACRGAERMEPRFPALTGDYLGQKPPGDSPELFAPGVFSSASIETVPVFSRDGREIYWTHGEFAAGGMQAGIMTSRLEDGRWTRPEPLPFSVFSPGIADSKPALSPDSRRLVFASNRPIKGRPDLNKVTKPGCLNLWMSERTSGGWNEPVPFGPEINTVADEDVPVFDGNGILHFISNRRGEGEDVYLSRFVDGRYDKPELDTSVPGFMTYFAPDQSYFILQRGSKTVKGAFDILISFKKNDGLWGFAGDMGDIFRTFPAFAVTASPDGKYLFFMSDRDGNLDVYWMSASIIQELKKKAARS